MQFETTTKFDNNQKLSTTETFITIIIIIGQLSNSDVIGYLATVAKEETKGFRYFVNF